MQIKHDILVMIIEDDHLSALILQDMLSDLSPSIRVTGIAATLKDAGALLKCLNIDLLFLDMELPDGKGFDLLSAMPEVGFEVIVTTAHSNYALEAIRQSALDFLVKPVNRTDLEKAMGRYMKKIESRYPVDINEKHPFPQCRKIPLPTLEGYVFIDYEDIIHVEADRSYAVFSLTGHPRITVSKPMGDFEERLFGHNFIRVHHSHIINLNRVSEYVRGEGGHVIMSDGSCVPVSRSHKEKFLEAIGFHQRETDN